MNNVKNAMIIAQAVSKFNEDDWHADTKQPETKTNFNFEPYRNPVNHKTQKLGHLGEILIWITVASSFLTLGGYYGTNVLNHSSNQIYQNPYLVASLAIICTIGILGIWTYFKYGYQAGFFENLRPEFQKLSKKAYIDYFLDAQTHVLEMDNQITDLENTMKTKPTSKTQLKLSQLHQKIKTNHQTLIQEYQLINRIWQTDILSEYKSALINWDQIQI